MRSGLFTVMTAASGEFLLRSTIIIANVLTLTLHVHHVRYLVSESLENIKRKSLEKTEDYF